MNNTFRILLWIGLALLIISIVFILNWKPIIDHSKANPYSYTILDTNEIIVSSIICNKLNNELKLIRALGNPEEQLSFYDFADRYKLIIWDIKGFSSVSPEEIEVTHNSKFKNILINPQNYIFHEDLSILFTSKVKHLMADEIVLHLNEVANFIEYSRDSNLLYLIISGKGFAISDKNVDYKLKIDFKTSKNMHVAFMKTTNSFQVLILLPIKKGDEIDNSLFNYLNN